MSKVRTALVLAAGLGLAAASQATAAPSMYKITGGGQVMTPESVYANGALDTLAYTAQGNGTTAKGQVQYVARGTQSGTSFHGVVNGLMGVTANEQGDGGMGEICGVIRGTTTPFTIYVVDGGEGSGAMDSATLTTGGDADCDGDYDGAGEGPNGSDAPKAAVARGNAQVHKIKSAEGGTTTQGGGKGGRG